MLLTNHTKVLVCVARDPRASLIEISESVGVAERTVQRLLADLENAGYLSRVRADQRNRYTVHLDAPLPPPASESTVGELLDALGVPAQGH